MQTLAQSHQHAVGQSVGEWKTFAPSETVEDDGMSARPTMTVAVAILIVLTACVGPFAVALFL